MYVYGGVAKLNGDWLHGEPMHTWLLERASSPLIGLIVRHGWGLAIFSYGGLFFDICVVPGLLWKRTRPYAFCVAVMFHIVNSQLFNIGIFPWMMIAATTLFFDADWPRRICCERRQASATPRASTPAPIPGEPVRPLSRCGDLDAVGVRRSCKSSFLCATSCTRETSPGPKKDTAFPGG